MCAGKQNDGRFFYLFEVSALLCGDVYVEDENACKLSYLGCCFEIGYFKIPK